MKELTLRHLLLLVGKALSENEIDSDKAAFINEIGKTLSVSREKRSPYVLTWMSGSQERSLTVEDSTFAFHVRGDVPNRNPNQVDIRSKNWNAACLIWSDILGRKVVTDSGQLAPRFFSEIKQPKFMFRLQIILVVLIVTLAFPWSQKTGIALSGVLAINESLRVGDSPSRRGTSLLLMTFLTIITVAIIPNAAPAFIVLLVLEIVTAVFVFTSKEVAILSVGLCTSSIIYLSSSEKFFNDDASALFGFTFFTVFAVAALPFGRSGNLRRISVTFSIGVLYLCGSLNVNVLWACSLFLLLSVFPMNIRRRKIFLQPEEPGTTQVSIRQSRGL